jgi:hypothetical protein
MHFLIGAMIGLAIATVLIIGWAAGNLFACVFLSIPTALAMLIFAIQSPSNVGWTLACAGALCIIWTPYMARRQAARPIYFQPSPPPPVRAARPGEFVVFLKEAGAAVAICVVITLLLTPFFPH